MSAAAAGVMMTLFHWEKLSPAEFIQLQEYALCEFADGDNYGCKFLPNMEIIFY